MIKSKKNFILMTMLLAAGTVRSAAAADVYTIDKVHSRIGFAVRHLMVSLTNGAFSDYAGAIQFDPNDHSAFNAEVTIVAESINTNNADRDKHLKSADFLDAATFPVIIFKGKKLTSKTADQYEISGDLTIHGVTKEITIHDTISGPVQSPYGAQVIGLSGQTTINRQDFGVSWNKLMDQGGLMVDNMVKISIDIEADKK